MKLPISLLLFSLAILSLSCKKEENPSLQTQLDGGESIITLLEEYPVDSFFAKEYVGGYIFNLKANGSGMIVTKTDISTNAWWGCAGTTITGADGTTVGSGVTNTADIVAQCTDQTGAAGLCDNSSLGGKTDWYLPSEGELELIYQNVHLKGVGNFASNYYWSSTESSFANAAQHVLFDDGSVNFSTKTNAHYVRAVRNF